MRLPVVSAHSLLGGRPFTSRAAFIRLGSVTGAGPLTRVAQRYAMTKPRESKFLPHDFAQYREEAGTFASDRVIQYRWDVTHWGPLDDKTAESEAYRWIVKNNRRFASAENAHRAHQAAILWVRGLPQPTGQWVVPTLSGYLHLDNETPELRPADRELGLTHVLNCEYTPCGPAPKLFMALLARVLPDEHVRARVQEFVGYTLLPDARYQRAQFWIGEGANGKGVLANVIQALHGRVAAISLDDLSGFRMAGLIGASLIYVDEIPRRPIDEQRLKSAIAGETLQVDRKYRDALSIRLTGKWLVLGNHLPAITDHSSGFWRRWDVVPFETVIPEAERNPTLAQDIIATELSGVLNWALEGLMRLQARGGFDVILPKAMSAALSTAKAETNSVAAWVLETGVRVSATRETSKKLVFDTYRNWCVDNAMREVASGRFWTRMKGLLKDLEEARPRDDDGQQPRLVNVDLGLSPSRLIGAAAPEPLF